jgi:hypothetical protein
MTCARFLFLLVLPAVVANGQFDCVLPEAFCARLTPDTVVFVGKPISMVTGKYSEVTATFEIQERLWGLTNETVATVFFNNGYGDLHPKFLAVTRRPDGTYYSDSCGAGLGLPLDHPWVAEFRHGLAERKVATVAVNLGRIQVTYRLAEPIFNFAAVGSISRGGAAERRSTACLRERTPFQ